ncbi:MAG: zinc ribbon domain-containing protein [Treponema sp.]|jgi:uncharacterized membrane protein YvbJ|nr:zinc ribbon domain-containing protein [Treponema sp.]
MKSLVSVRQSSANVPPKKIRFFCDNCGTEVAREEDACPECGRPFSSVRCPTCGFSGSLDDFQECCPACGYVVYPQEQSAPKVPSRQAPPRYEYEGRSLPLWVYLITGLALIGMLTVVFLTLQ